MKGARFVSAFWRTLAAGTLVAYVWPLLGAFTVAAQGDQGSRRRDCRSLQNEPPVLSPDSIGYLSLSEPLCRLRELCGTATDTIVRLREGGTTYPVLSFR